MKTLEKLGEAGFIKAITRQQKFRHSGVIKGIGDDAAIVKYRKNKFLLLTSDMLIEDVHFKRNQRPRDIGHKAIACSISDIAAMGGTPAYALISVGFPKNLSAAFAKEIYQGLYKTARAFEVSIIGGDTNCAEKIIIDVFLCGIVEKNKVVLRGGAKKNDRIFVTGELGGSLKGKHLSFTPRVEQSRFLVENYPLNAMIDISDGLINDLGHIISQSGMGAILYKEAIPVCAQAGSLSKAYYDGEDFELLFTLSQKFSEKLIANWPFKKVRVSCIGEITQGKSVIKEKDECGRLKNIKKSGYQHFSFRG